MTIVVEEGLRRDERFRPVFVLMDALREAHVYQHVTWAFLEGNDALNSPNRFPHFEPGGQDDRITAEQIAFIERAMRLAHQVIGRDKISCQTCIANIERVRFMWGLT